MCNSYSDSYQNCTENATETLNFHLYYIGFFYTKWPKLSKFMKKMICLFVFVALRPKSTAMVIAGRSVHLSTLFPEQAVNQ